jgi:L-iditol 2-dehydrogenase
LKAAIKIKPEPGLSMKEVAAPEPGVGEVLVKVRASGVCGSDLHLYEWTSGYEWIKDSLPLVMGHEFSGEITAVGDNVSIFQTGDRVACMPGNPCGSCLYCRTDRHVMCAAFRATMLGFRKNGSLADYITVPAAQCFSIPDDVSYEEAALLEPLVTAASAVESGNPQLGSSVIVLGPGPIGLMVAMLARASGAGQVLVVGAEADEYRLDLALKLGATDVLNVANGDIAAAVFKSIGPEGADLVFEATGNPSSIKLGLMLLQKSRKMVVLGIHPSPIQLDLTSLVREGKAISGSYAGSPGLWERMISFLAVNSKIIDPLITHRYSLEETIEAFELCLNKQSGKVIVTGNQTGGV